MKVVLLFLPSQNVVHTWALQIQTFQMYLTETNLVTDLVFFID